MDFAQTPAIPEEGKWEEALEQYTFGLESENVPPDQKGLLLSNRLRSAETREMDMGTV